jgi:hypothetical protein
VYKKARSGVNGVLKGASSNTKVEGSGSGTKAQENARQKTVAMVQHHNQSGEEQGDCDMYQGWLQ